jgi:hypothetical protein
VLSDFCLAFREGNARMVIDVIVLMAKAAVAKRKREADQEIKMLGERKSILFADCI